MLPQAIIGAAVGATILYFVNPIVYRNDTKPEVYPEESRYCREQDALTITSAMLQGATVGMVIADYNSPYTKVAAVCTVVSILLMTFY